MTEEHAKCTYCSSPRGPGHDLYVCLDELRRRLLASEQKWLTLDDKCRAMEAERDTARELTTHYEAEHVTLRELTQGIKTALDSVAVHLPTVLATRVLVAHYPATDKEDAARWMAEHARASTETTIWSVYIPDESIDMSDGTIDGKATAITGNGPRSEAHAYVYAMLHNLVRFLRSFVQEGKQDA